MESGYMKKAVQVDPKTREVFLECVCREKVPLPQIKGMPMTYICGNCGTEYDGRGWILNKQAK